MNSWGATFVDNGMAFGFRDTTNGLDGMAMVYNGSQQLIKRFIGNDMSARFILRKIYVLRHS